MEPREPEPEPEVEPARPAKPTKITLQLCQEAIFPDHYSSTLDSESMMHQLFETTKLRLNDMAIVEIDNLEMFVRFTSNL